MNCEIFNLQTLQVHEHELTEVANCLLSTIVFHRALGPVKPVAVESDIHSISWVSCGDKSVEKRIEDKISQLYSWVLKNRGKKAQVCLSFYERRQTQAWFTKSEQRLYWEQWYINFEVYDSLEVVGDHLSLETESVKASRKERLEIVLENCLTTIIRLVNEKKDHIPPVVSGAAVTFPFDITIAGEAQTASFGFDLVRRMLSSTNPPSVLH